MHGGNNMPDELKLILKYSLAFLLVYFVYRDSKKKNIRHRNLWIVFALLFPPTAIAYLLYSILASKKVVLSSKQKVDIAIRMRAAEHKKKIAIERESMEKATEEEAKKNNLTLEEIEKIKNERIEAKKKRLQELKEERLYQQEENAKKMRMSSHEEYDNKK